MKNITNFNDINNGQPFRAIVSYEAFKEKKKENVIKTLLTDKNLDKNNEKACLTYDNEKPTGILVIGNGCDFLLEDYFRILELKYQLNLDIKVINKGLYRKIKNLPEYTLKEYEEFLNNMKNYENCSFLLNNNYEDIKCYFNSYIKNIVLPMKYDKKINREIIHALNNLKIKIKEKKQLHTY